MSSSPPPSPPPSPPLPSPPSPSSLRWHYNIRCFHISNRYQWLIVMLLYIVILIVFSSLCKCWACRNVETLPPPSSTVDSPSPPRGGLDLSEIRNLPIVLYRKSEAAGGEAECCICLGIFRDEEKVKVLPDCCHCFHAECVDKWLAAQASCPLCRVSVGVNGSPV